MNDFYNYFVHSIKNPNLSSVTTKYYTLRNKYKYFVFVEGKDDKDFYSITLRKKIPAKFPADIGYIISGGKENVLDIYEYLFTQNSLKQLNNHYFIVDKDYDENINFKYIYKRVTQTRYYSFENYFFEKENLICVLNEIKLSEKNIQTFLELFQDYLIRIIDYETLLCLNVGYDVFTSINHNLLNDSILNIKNDEITFDYSFVKEISDVINKLTPEQHNMFLKVKQQLINNLLNIRGHDFELFFNKMMKNYSIDFQFKDILKNVALLNKIKVNINLK